MAKVNEIHIEKLVDTVAKTLVEAFENLTIEDVNMYQIGYNKAIEEFKQELLKHQEGNVDTFVWCSDINRIAEQMKAGGENGNK